MLRELNTNEMEMVSGGMLPGPPPGPCPGIWPSNPTDDQNAHDFLNEHADGINATLAGALCGAAVLAGGATSGVGAVAGLAFCTTVGIGTGIALAESHEREEEGE